MLLASTDLASLQVGDDPTVRVARAQWLDPWTKTPVLWTSKSVGLMLISAEGRVLTKRTVISATGVQNLPPDQPFYILVGNFTNKRQYLPKRMKIATASEAPKVIFDHTQKQGPAAPRETQQTAFSTCLLYTSPSPRDLSTSRMPSSA